MNSNELVEPFIKSMIMDIYTSDQNYIEFEQTDDFTNQDKYIYLAKLTYKRIKIDAVNNRINACIEEGDMESLAIYTRKLAQTVITLEQSIFEAAHKFEENGADETFNEVADLYAANMDYESTEVFESIKKILKSMELF